MTTARTDDVALLRAANPVADPEAAVEPAVREATLDRVLASAADAPSLRRPLRPRRRTVRRAALVTGIAVAAIAALLVTGEQRSAPQRFAVLPALADELSSDGRILHVLERTVKIGPDGERRGGVHVEEGWTLLDDSNVFRFRIGTGKNAEQGAYDRHSSSDYDAKTNTIRIVRREVSGPPTRVEPPVSKMARDAASGKIPIVDRPVINGRRTLKIVDDGITWYIAEDAPVLVRRELLMRNGGVQRSDYVAFEILEATPANRKLLEIQAPRDARVVTVKPRPMPNIPRRSEP